MKNTLKIIVPLLGVTLAAGSLQAATILYNQSFTGGATGIGGTAPTVNNYGGSPTWGANSLLNLNGSITTGDVSALAFTPSTGMIYTLTATISTTVGRLGVGFLPNDTSGYGWILSSPVTPVGLAETAYDGWTVYPGGVQHVNASNDFKIVLDTTATDWSVAFYLSDVQQGSTFTYSGGNPAITHVGFINPEGNAAGTVSAFELSAIPEPTSLALFGLGGAVALFRRRR